MALWPLRRREVSAAPVRAQVPADDPEGARRWLDEAAERAGFAYAERRREAAELAARIELARREWGQVAAGEGER